MTPSAALTSGSKLAPMVIDSDSIDNDSDDEIKGLQLSMPSYEETARHWSPSREVSVGWGSDLPVKELAARALGTKPPEPPPEERAPTPHPGKKRKATSALVVEGAKKSKIEPYQLNEAEIEMAVKWVDEIEAAMKSFPQDRGAAWTVALQKMLTLPWAQTHDWPYGTLCRLLDRPDLTALYDFQANKPLLQKLFDQIIPRLSQMGSHCNLHVLHIGLLYKLDLTPFILAISDADFAECMQLLSTRLSKEMEKLIE